MTVAEKKNPAWFRRFSPVAYALMVGIGLLQAVRGDLATAAGSLWIAPIFDPFASAGAWPTRAAWQKAWLYVHAAVALAVTVLAALAASHRL